MVAFSKGKGMVVTSILNSFFLLKKHMSKLNHHWMEALLCGPEGGISTDNFWEPSW